MCRDRCNYNATFSDRDEVNTGKMTNDMTIFYGIAVFFIVLGGVLPFIQSDFGQATIDNQIDPLKDGLNNAVEESTKINAFDVIVSMFKMLFWSFGDIPLLLELIVFEPVRLLMYFIFARNIWVGGGG